MKSSTGKRGTIKLDGVEHHYLWCERGSLSKSGLAGFTKHFKCEQTNCFCTETVVVLSRDLMPGAVESVPIPGKLTEKVNTGGPQPLFGKLYTDENGIEYQAYVREITLDEIARLKAAGVWPNDVKEAQPKDGLAYDPENYTLTWTRKNGDCVYDTLNDAQNIAFKILLDAFSTGNPDVSNETLSKATCKDRHADVWRSKARISPFWQTLVKQFRRGWYRLDPAEEMQQKTSRRKKGTAHTKTHRAHTRAHS